MRKRGQPQKQYSFFQHERKMSFIQTQKNSYKRIFFSLFNKGKEIEERLNKDIYEFTLEECQQLIRLFKPKNIPRVTHLCLTFGIYLNEYKLLRDDKTNPLIYADQNWKKQCLPEAKKYRLSELELQKIISDCVNAQDSCMYLMLFEGVDLDEIINLKKSDINSEGRTLSLTNERNEKRNLNVSEHCILLIQEACIERIYLGKNGEGKRYTKLENEYVLNANKRSDKRDAHLIHRRIRLLKDVFKYPDVTAKGIRFSGMMRYAVKVSREMGVPIRDFKHTENWSRVAKRFNDKETKVNGYLQYTSISKYVNVDEIYQMYTDELKELELSFITEQQSLLLNNKNLSTEEEQDFELVDSAAELERTTRKKRYYSSSFRQKVIEVYGRCVVTDETLHEVLEACHIEPHKNESSDHIQNGILLRSDIHDLFDSGLLWIDLDYRVTISPLVHSKYYHSFHGKLIHLPKNPKHYPSKKALSFIGKVFKNTINEMVL